MDSDNGRYPSCWATVQGLRVHYKSLGQGPPVVLLHGGGNDWREWRMNIEFLARGLRVIVLDLPGYGLSQSPEAPVSPAWGVAFLAHFLDVVKLPAAHLAGDSLGGMVALAFTLEHPARVKRLVLIDSGGLGQLSPGGRLLYKAVKLLDRLMGKAKGPRFERVPARDWLLVDRLAEIRAPTMIFWCDNDPYLPVSQAELAHRLIAGSRLHVFPGCRHAPHRACAEKVNNLMYEFLTQ